MKRRSFVFTLLMCFASAPVRAADPIRAGGAGEDASSGVPDRQRRRRHDERSPHTFACCKERGEPIDIELVAFGGGLKMLRADVSPVKRRIAEAHAAHPTLIMFACENSRRAFARLEGKEIPILPEARPAPSGVVRLSELQEQGRTYLRP